MKRTVLFLSCLMIAGAFAYFGGYYFYTSSNPKTEIIEPETLQRATLGADTGEDFSREYYIGKIEKNMLNFYKMPEETLYDSVEIKSLQFHGDEERQLTEGMIFQTLTEIYEFLENSMS